MVPLRQTAALDGWARKVEGLAAWLIGPARLSGDAVAVTSGFAERLISVGVPLHRLRIAMRVDNPLLGTVAVT
jgi:adenylate cyclase